MFSLFYYGKLNIDIDCRYIGKYWQGSFKNIDIDKELSKNIDIDTEKRLLKKNNDINKEI